MNEPSLKNAVEPDFQPPYDSHHESLFQSPGLWMISGLLVIAALANFMGTWLLWNFVGPLTETLVSFALGLLTGEICLIGIWLALGSQGLLLRACLSLGSLFALTCLFILGFYCFDEQVPAEVPLLFFGISFVFVGMMCVPLGLVRWRAKRVISRKIVKQDNETSQFGIRHLLIATAVTAVLVVLGQNAFPETEFQGDAPWLEILSFIAVYMLLSCLICLLSLASVFARDRRWLNILLLVNAVLIGPSIAAAFLAHSFGNFRSGLSEHIINAMSYSASMALGLVTVLAAFYVAGYKFQKP